VEPYVTAETIESRAKGWLERVGPFNRHEMRLDVPTSALIVVDFTCGGLAVLPGIARLVAVFRAAGRPVIYTRHVHHPDGIDAGIMGWWWEGMCVEGSPESEVHPDLTPMSDEKVVLKHRYSAFYNTDLETVLRCMGVEDLVITGLMTNLCCESTARDAYFRDHRVFFPADGNGSVNEELHVASLLNLAFGTTMHEIAGRVASGG
jgi:nicotinamidase-related amidase